MGGNQSRSESTAAAAGGRRLADSVFEMYKPENEEEIVCEVIFFHGLQMTTDKEKVKGAYRTTWRTADGKDCWLQTFLPEAFGNKIRILSVTYDSAAFKTSKTGRFDLYLIGEHLVGGFINNSRVNVGQRGVPLILVAHSFSGMAVKKMVYRANRELNDRPSKENHNSLKNLKGVFFYATPHLGASVAEYQKYLPPPLKVGPVLPLSSDGSRLNAKFDRLKTQHDFLCMGLMETEATQLVRVSLINLYFVRFIRALRAS